MPDPNKDAEGSKKEDLEGTDTDTGTDEGDAEVKKEPVKEIDEEPSVRRSAKDHIITRKDEKIEKLKKEKEEKVNDEFSPEGRDLIQSKIDRAVRPVLDQVRGQSDSQELSEVIEKYGDSASKLKGKIQKYMDHPAYQNVPVEFIFLGLAQQGIKRAEKKDAADDEAARDATGGTQKRPKKIAKIPNVGDMTDKEMGSLIHKVRTGQF